MKRSLQLGFAALFLLSVMRMGAQEAAGQTKNNNRFYIGPLDLLFNTLELGYERDLRNHNSIAVNGGFKLTKKDGYNQKLGGVGELQYRVNLHYNKEAISKLNNRNYSTFAYFAPFASYRYEEAIDKFTEAKDTTTYMHSFFGGFGFGFRLTAYENRFCFNAFAGGGMKYSDVYGLDQYTDFLESGYTGIAPKFSVQIGIAF